MTPEEIHKFLKKSRGYGLGERDPRTLPGVYNDSENYGTAQIRNAFWRSLRRKVQNATGC